MPQGFQTRHTRVWREKNTLTLRQRPRFPPRRSSPHCHRRLLSHFISIQSERSGHSTSPRGPRCSSAPATKWGPRLDGEIITATHGIKSNCVAYLSFIKDFSQLTFSRCDVEKTRPTTELFEKVTFKLSRVPRCLPLYYELTLATL